ncbi:unnamed protein product [Lampetra planeri]
MASSIELERFYSKEVEFPPPLLASHIKTAEREVHTLLAGMRRILRPDIDPSIQQDIVRTGSSYEGLKVNGDMELDFLIVLSHPEFKFIPMTSHYSGYRNIKAERQPRFPLQAVYTAIKIEGDLFVVAKPLKTSPDSHLWRLSFSVFEKKIISQLPSSSCHLKALKILKYLREHDPRLEETSQFASGICSYHLKTASLHLLAQRPDTPEGLDVCLYQLMDFLLELLRGPLFAIKIEGDLYAVAKPLKTSPDPHLWRLSFSVFEKNILRQHQSSCHLKALKILKYLREHDPRLEETSQFASGICSYHLKTASLHLLAQRPNTPEDLHERLHQLMDFLIECMQRRELNHFFIGNPSSLAEKANVPSSITHGECCLNLFDDKFVKESTLNQARERLVKIKGSLPAIIQRHSGPVAYSCNIY